MSAPRPTIRCLFDDLADTIEDQQQRSALLSGSLPGPETPLEAIAHPILRAARDRYSVDTPPERRDLVGSVRDELWAKCRHGERWRGVVWWHATDQRWVCYAGWREAGDPDDIYALFESACQDGSEAFHPTQDDWLRLKGERIYLERVASEQQLRVAVLTAIVEAITQVGTTHHIALPSGSRVSVRVEPATSEGFAIPAAPVGTVDEPDASDGHSDDEWMGDLFIRVAVDWESTSSSADEALLAREAVPGIAEEEWEVVASTAGDQFPEFWVMVDGDWATRLLTAVHEHGIASLSEDPRIVLDPDDNLAHVATSRSVNSGYINGQLIRSVCGRRFIPSRVPDDEQVCDVCRDFQAAWATVREGLRQ